MLRLFIIFTIFVIGCTITSRLTSNSPIAEENKDVLILSTFVRDYLKRTNGRIFTLSELRQIDTLKRIVANFDKAELKTHGGYISVYFKFSQSRDKNKIELTEKEKDMLLWNKWKEKQISGPYDGEIQFAFGEKLYHIKKLIVKN